MGTISRGRAPKAAQPPAPKARRAVSIILDLYAGTWQGERLHPADYVACADEKPSIQAP